MGQKPSNKNSKVCVTQSLLNTHSSQHLINVLLKHAEGGKNVKCVTYHLLLEVLFEISFLLWFACHVHSLAGPCL